MWIVFIILGVPLLVLLAILVMPFELEISTLRNVYEVRAGKIAVAGIEINDEGVFSLKIRVLWWKKEIAIFEQKINRKKQKNEKKVQKWGTKKFTVKNIPARIISVLKSFKAERFYLDIDTDDFILNAYLYPLFFLIKVKTGKPVQINFMGKTDADILIKNNLLRMGVAFIKYKK